jgi:predicted metallo-beta-lactamase superfamily hydrolase
MAFESLGVRSMSTFIKTPDVRILIDAGLSLGPRFGILPHPKEYAKRSMLRTRLKEIAKKSDIVTISHYHNDHYTPSFKDTVFIGSSKEDFEQIYQDKCVLLKDFREKINYSQRRRGWIFQKSLNRIARRIKIADSKTFDFGDTSIKFSHPTPHGEDNSVLGWVLMISVIVDENKIIHASDIQGPSSVQALNWILSEKPALLILGGPPTYLENYYMKENLQILVIGNLKKLISAIPIIVLDHHPLRAEVWKEWLEPLKKYAKNLNHKIVTAAEFCNQKNMTLEAKRESLYNIFPPNEEFMNWVKLPKEKRKLIPPPLS